VKAAEPDEVDLLVDERFNCCRIVVDGCELDLHAERTFKVFDERAELAHLLGGGFFWNGRDLEYLLSLGRQE
jgi:hypothetical protein